MCVATRQRDIVAQNNGHAVAGLKDTIPTKAELKAVIPKHCFERSTAHSLWLVLRDGLVIAPLLLAAFHYLPVGADASWYHWGAWGLYSLLQGTALTGWWVLAHECGHGAFSPHTIVNDTVGFVLHSILLVPYFAWQFSHGKHHAKTNHLLDGETHNPSHKKAFYKSHAKIADVLGEEAFAVFQMIVSLGFGWPMYLITNATGARRIANTGESARKYTIDHFRPSSKLFPRHFASKIALSTLGLVAWISTLVYLGSIFGGLKVFMLYFPSYLVVNFWLVLYTWLHHTDPKVPHFGDSAWTWMRGALCTIDRPYTGFNWIHHNIGSTHVAHHLFSTIPSYHAVEATAALKAYLEPKGLYNYDPSAWPVAVYRIAKSCHFVESVDGVQYLKAHKFTTKKLSKESQKK